MSITREDLLKGQQPDSLESYVGQAIGAATTIQYGPGIDEVFDDASAVAILDWAVEGIQNLDQRRSDSD